MTPFTDDDLKRLKDRIEYEDADATVTLWELAPLLARLEAAEAYINSMPEDVTDDNDRLYKEWRKAAGK